MFKKIYDTVSEQTFDGWELIVIDDGSKDFDSLESEVNSLNDSRVKLIPLTRNQGGGAARNAGILNATNKYIAFLDSDDFWHKDKLRQQVDFLEANAADILFTSVEVVGLDGASQKSLNVKYERDQDVSEYIFKYDGVIQTSSIMIKTSIAKQVLFNPVLKRHQDYDFILRLYHLGYKIFKLDAPYTYWVDDGKTVFNRGATFEESSTWLLMYHQYMSKEGKLHYNAKVLFWMARNSNNLTKYVLFNLTNFGLYCSFRVCLMIFKRLTIKFRKIISRN